MTKNILNRKSKRRIVIYKGNKGRKKKVNNVFATG